MSLKNLLSKSLDSIQNTVNDLSSLSVTTITGDIQQSIQDKEINLKAAIENISNGNTDANMEIIAHTHIDFDQDAIQFVKSDLKEDEQKLYDLHQSMIQSSIESRQAFLKFIQEVLD